MRRLLALLGGIAFVRAWLARRRGREAPGELDPRAEELKLRLAESREVAGDQEEFASGETPVDAEERRRDVHRRGRAAIDELGRDG